MLCLTVTKFVDVPLETLAAQILLFFFLCCCRGDCVFWARGSSNSSFDRVIEWTRGEGKEEEKKQLMFGCVEQVLLCFWLQEVSVWSWGSRLSQSGSESPYAWSWGGTAAVFFLNYPSCAKLDVKLLGCFFFNLPSTRSFNGDRLPLTDLLSLFVAETKETLSLRWNTAFPAKTTDTDFFFPLPFFGFWN